MSTQELIQLEEELLRRAQHLREKMLLRWPVGTVVRFYFTPAQRRRGTYSQGIVQGPGAQATATLRVRVVVRKHTQMQPTREENESWTFTSGISWARFLVARADMIDALHRDGMSDKHIAATLSAEATQVFLIRTRDRSTDYVMRGTENEELRSQITNLRELVRKAYIEGRNHGSFAESVEDSQRRIIEGTDKRPTWETSETCREMEDEKWKP